MQFLFLCQIRKDLVIIRGVAELSYLRKEMKKKKNEFSIIIHYVQMITIKDWIIVCKANITTRFARIIDLLYTFWYNKFMKENKLLNLTNGIVQGMSGSPIIQSGKLVGAVTHVFLNDSTRGFGIDIANMLNN